MLVGRLRPFLFGNGTFQGENSLLNFGGIVVAIDPFSPKKKNKTPSGRSVCATTGSKGSAFETKNETHLQVGQNPVENHRFSEKEGIQI